MNFLFSCKSDKWRTSACIFSSFRWYYSKLQLPILESPCPIKINGAYVKRHVFLQTSCPKAQLRVFTSAIRAKSGHQRQMVKKKWSYTSAGVAYIENESLTTVGIRTAPRYQVQLPTTNWNRYMLCLYIQVPYRCYIH